jgi:transposase
VDASGLPLAAVVTQGQAHESKHFVELMEAVRPPRWFGWPIKVAGDKGYSYTHVRAWLERRLIAQVIPQRSDQIERRGGRGLDRAAYKKRAKVEQCVGWLKENRRVGTRYDKLATSFHAFVNLAIIRRYLRLLAPDDPSDRA